MQEDLGLEEERPKKILVWILSIFLIFLLLSYFLLGSPLYHIFESLFESKVANENQIIVGDLIIQFKEDIYTKLQDKYYENQSVEFVSCLIGEKQRNNYIITQLYTPKISDQSFNHISFKPCSEDTLILIHSHPYRRCIASQQDIETLEKIKQINPGRLMIIMCEPNRFSVYN